MANILGTFAAIILAVAAFVAFKNKGKFAMELENKVAEEAKLASSQSKLKDTLEKLRALPEERAGIDAQSLAKDEEEVKLKEENETLKEKIEETTEVVNKMKLNNGEAQDGAPDTGTIKKFAAMVKKLSAETEELNTKLETKESELASVTQEIEATEVNAKRIKEEIEALSSGESISTLKTSIRNIYPNWGFVTLNAGNVAGVASGSILDVVRDGNAVAKLLVTSVEGRTSSASIIPDSVIEGVVLSAGDLVVPGKISSNVTSN
jgi:hypothetical protein